MGEFGRDLVQALNEALAHARGEDATMTVHPGAAAVDPKSVRESLSLTQREMASFLGASLSGYRKWEQGVRLPSGAARTLLLVMQREPAAVLRALSADRGQANAS